MTRVIPLLVLCAGVGGCTCDAPRASRALAAGRAGHPDRTRPAHGLSPAEAQQVVARIDDREITILDYADELMRERGDARLKFNLPAHRPELLDRLLRDELLADEARRRGYATDARVLRARREALVRLVADEVRAGPRIAPPAEAALRDRYEAQHSRWNTPERVRIRYIRASDPAAAQRILDALLHGNPHHRAKEFLHLSEQLPATPMMQRLGEMGPFPRPDERRPEDPAVPDAVALAAFATPAGDLSPEVVEAEGSFYVVENLVLLPATRISFEQARSRLIAQARAETQAERLEQLTLRGRRITFDERALGQAIDPRDIEP